ncbi:NmrA family NAD(P)-binding protein [Haloferax larsenii]|uniref:NmrA family NAD(P)-binding protein n=1 Tax=Haloferax larsenii TaxID=302484 RepID=A0ABY5RIU3_HALLR|nr:NmrA family NAD(P)-binding protein [Haloferax larsenii]UVE51080.1 NmrA family NAD(P)-binding protein [Haloferax larsenii]
MTAQRVLVTAGTGTVGQHVVRELRDDVEVRVGTRRPQSVREAGDSDSDSDEHVVEFDFARPETWGAALDGVDATFLVRPPGVEQRQVTAFVDAASRVRVDHVVYLSALGADKNVLIPHHRIESHIQQSAVRSTFLRASFFTQNLHEVHGQDVVEHDEIFVPAGSGETSFVDARDVAAVAAVVLTDDRHDKQAYDLTGPEALRYDEVAAVFTDVLDRRITYADPSIPAFVRRMLSRDRPLSYVLLMVGIYSTARFGFAGRVTDDVERLLGRPPRTVRDYVEDYRDRFEPARTPAAAHSRER